MSGIKLTLHEALDIFADHEADIISACQANIMQSIRSHQPAKELDVDKVWTAMDIKEEVNRLFIAKETEPMVKVINAIKRRQSPVPTKGGVTDEMIARAKEYPVDELIEFKRRLAKCLWHDDTNPSLSHFKKANRVSCFVCNKTWSSIDIVMEQDRCNFVQAVKRLNN